MAILVLAGMIGVGKSTYTTMIADKLGTTPFYESVEDNEILEKYYEDAERWAFSLQIHFLNTRFKSIKEAFRCNNNVLDRSAYEDSLFTYINYLQGNISKAEYDIYTSLLDNMMEELDGMEKKAPDLLIYLTGNFDTILEHIKMRGRDFEQVDNDPELLAYYKLLYEHYVDWFNAYDKSPKMTISVDEYDILKNPEDVDKVMELINAELTKIRG